jgi:acyl dehydratase
MAVRWEDIAEGREPEPLVLGPLTRTDFVRYQGASGDMQPIHHDEPFARAAGYEAPLAVGMLHAGALANWAAAWLGPENVRRTRLRWKAQAWPGDVLECGGRVARKYEENGERRVDLELVCRRRQDGRTIVEGWMTFVVP